MNNKKIMRNMLLSLVALMFSTSLWAHGGAKGTDTDQCKLEIRGEWVHYTAYQPFISQGEEFCASIPELNTPTNLVFDYIGSKLRKMQIEFEITKEPEGTVIYHQDAGTHKTGSINATINFKEKGDYLVHVKLIPETGDAVDKHISFSVGSGKATSTTNLAIYFFIFLGLVYILYLSNAGAKAAIDKLLGKIKEW